MKTKLIVLGLIVLLSGCSKSTLVPGTYVQKPVSNKIRWTSEEFKFLSENKFEYTYLSDDLNSSRHGSGNYKVKNDKLQMEFNKEPSVSPKSVVISKEIQQADTSQNIFRIHVKTYKGNSVAGANIILIDSNRNDIIGNTDINGKAELRVPKGSTPTHFKTLNIGFVGIVYELPKSRNLLLEVVLAENFSTQITNKLMERRIKVKKEHIIIDGREYQINTLANKN